MPPIKGMEQNHHLLIKANVFFFFFHIMFNFSLMKLTFSSNASDALDKLRFLSVTEPALLKEAVDLDIRIQTDQDNGIITLT